MGVNSTILRFETLQQSLWRPGPAESFSFDTGDTMIYTLPPVRWDIGFDLLGNGIEGEFFFDARFGLFAYADLGTGGHFDAYYDIEVKVGMPSAIIAGDDMIFDFSDYRVVDSGITTVGAGTSGTSASGTIGAGLDLIIELQAGIRDFSYFTWFGGDGPFTFNFFDVDQQIELIGVTLDDPEFSFELFKGLTLTAQLPTGASITDSTSTNGGGKVAGSGISDREFLTLDADLDELLVRLTKEIPKVGAVTKVLGETLFAEHRLDLNKIISQIPKGKVGLDFTLLDVSASAGLAITEEVSLDINRPGTQIPDVMVRLTSDNGTPGNTGDDFSETTQLGQSVALASPTTGVGDANITAEYFINRASFFHGVGLGLNVSVTVDILYGKLSGDWVPSFLEFGFGPLFTKTFPEGGFTANLGNVYTDTFEVAGDAFNTEERDYSVFYVEQALAPTGWNPTLPGAEERIYAYFQAAYDQIAAVQAQYSDSYSNIQPQGTPQSSYDFSGTASTLFVWTGAFDQSVTLGTSNGSMAVVDLSGATTTLENLRAAQNGFNFIDWDISTLNVYNRADSAGAAFSPGVKYEWEGKEFSTNYTAEVVGGVRGDVLFYRAGASFFDGADNIGSEYDLFIADFSVAHPNDAVEWDLNDDSVQLFGSVDIRNVEAVGLTTGSGEDYIVTQFGGGRNALITGAGKDIVDLMPNRHGDIAALGDDDDALLYSWTNQTASNTAPEADAVSGGTGNDHVFVTTLNNGLRYDMRLNFEGTFWQFGGGGIGHDAEFQQVGNLYDSLANFSFGILTGNTALDNAAGGGTANSKFGVNVNHIALINGTTDRGSLRILPDVEQVSVINANTGSDLMIYMGGTRYIGGSAGFGGYDTFAADFARFEGLYGTQDGVRIRPTGLEIDGYWGETVIDGFERWLVRGTSVNDFLQGGTRDDHLEGGQGNDTLDGGRDGVGDRLYGGDGNDLIVWHDNGSDTIRGGDGIDTLDIRATASSPNRFVYRFTADEAGNTLLGDFIYYYAYDTIDDLLIALDLFLDPDVFKGHSFDGSTFTHTSGIERTNVVGSDDEDDLFFYDGGTVYDAGAWRADGENTFVGDLSHFEVSIDFQIDDDEADSIVLANTTLVKGMDRAVLKAGAGSDVLSGGRLNDYFHGGAGDDTILGGGGDNMLDGGEGSDLFFWSAEGNDTILGGVEGASTSDLDRDVDALVMGWEDGPSSLLLWRFTGPFTEESITPTALTAASSHDDILLASYFLPQLLRTEYEVAGRSVRFEAIEEVDIAASNDHDDVVLFHYGTAYVGGDTDGDLFIANFTRGRYFPGSEPDYGDLHFRADRGDGEAHDIGDGTLLSGFERFHLILAEGDHIVEGGDLGDYVDGGDGAVQFLSGAGDDFFRGGSGGRNLMVHSTGNDRYELFGARNDLAYEATDAVTVEAIDDLTGDPAGALLEAGISDFADFQVLTTHGLRYEMFHGANSLYVYGQATSVLAIGSDGNDVLIGGDGESRLMGGAGDDVLITGSNASTVMMGSTGADTYVFGATIFGNATILDESDSDTVLMFLEAEQGDISYQIEGTTLRIDVEPAGFVPSQVRIEGYFEDSVAGRGFTIQTTDATFGIDLGGLTGFTGAPVPELTVLSGTDGDDEFGPGNHLGRRIELFAGDNFVMGGPGSDTILGGAGRDAISYAEAPSSVEVNMFQQRGFAGWAEGDVYNLVEMVVGSEFDDTIVGSGDDNSLATGGGNDDVYAGGGDNTVFLGEGDDTAQASYGDDLIYGEEGDDYIEGDEGGVDGGKDTLFGGADNDTLFGHAGRDLLFGGDGDDELHGGADDDVLMYEAGTDLFFGGAGEDWASFFGLETGITFDLSGTGEVRENTGPGGALLATLTGVEAVRGTDSDDLMIGDGEDNSFDAQFGDDTMVGHEGDDTFLGFGPNDLVDYSQETGSQGIDLVWQAFGPTPNYVTGTDSHGDTDVLDAVGRVRGTDMNDNIQGNQRDNVIWGMDGFDVISGLGGDDLIHTGEGNGDLLFGDQGNDTLIADGGFANDLRGGDDDDMLISGPGSASNTLRGGAGFNTASYIDRTIGIEVGLEFASGYTGDVYTSGTDSDTLYDIQHIIGSQGNDTFRGGDDDDIFSHAGGLDQVFGGAGANTITFFYFDAAVSVVTGSGDVFTNDLENANDPAGLGSIRKIMGFEDIQTIEGSRFDDALTANGGGFVLSGGEGDDTLQSNLGDNFLLGGDGDDTIILDPQTTGMVVADGGGDTDFLRARDGSIAVRLSLADGRGGDVVKGVEGLIGTVGDDTLIGNAGGNIFRPGFGNDEMTGFDGDNLFVYSGGNDTVFGGNGRDAIDLSEFAHAARVDLGNTETVRTNDSASAEEQPGMRVAVEVPDVNVENVIGSAQSDHITGTSDTNMFNGGLGDDTIIGVGGDNIFVYEGGVDSWTGGSGADSGNFSQFGFAIDVNLLTPGVNIRHRGGTDVLSGSFVDMVAATGIAHLLGTAFDDRILGDHGANEIHGIGGDDRLFGRDGNDQVHGGDGADEIYGGADQDTLSGGAGSDTLYGGAGQDMVFGGAGDDEVRGGAGDDTVSGDEGDDAVHGDAGNDTLFGGAGDDTLEGGDGGDELQGDVGEDLLSGGEGSDTVSGGIGDDTLHGDGGDDTLEGGAGNDMLVGGSGGDFLNGGEGRDMVSYAGSALGVTASLQTGAASGGDAAGDSFLRIEDLSGSAQADELEGDDRNNRLHGEGGDDTLRGLEGDDRLWGGDGADDLSGGAGKDLLDGGADGDTLDGGAGDDTLLGDAGEDSLLGGDGQDQLDGGDGRDTLAGGAGDDILKGGDGDDLILGDEGIDALYGGEGDDTLRGGAGGDALYGGSGRNRADYDGAPEGVFVDLQSPGLNTGWAAFDLYVNIQDLGGSSGDDDLRGDGQGNVIHGGAGADTLRGRSGDDVIHGGIGNDVIAGNSGNDTLRGGDGDDRIFTGLDDNMVWGDAGADEIYGGVGADILRGGSGDDSIHGGEGNDVIAGNDGNDTLEGEDGNDRIFTGLGDNMVRGGDGADEIFGGLGSNTLRGGSGDDVIEGGEGNDVIAGNSGNDTLHGGEGDDRIFTGLGENVVRGGGGADEIFGGEGNDVIAGNDGNDMLYGNGGADRIFTGLGDDMAWGGDGADEIFGGVGVNILRGEAGDDVIHGGDGDDVIAGNDGNDMLHGDGGNDRIFTGTGDNLAWGDDGADEIFGGGGANLIRGEAGNDILQGGTGNDTLAGNDGADTIHGGAGDNRLIGGLGDDSLLAGSGDDTMQGDAGADMFIWTDAAQSPWDSRDTVADFESGVDRIDIAAIQPGLSFAPGGFTGLAGQVWFSDTTSTLWVDLNGSGGANFGINLDGVTAIDAGDLIL